jgi:hypothetical protein
MRCPDPMPNDNTLFLPFIDESEIDTNKVTVNELSFQNYVAASVKFLKKIRKLDKLTTAQRKQAELVKEAADHIIARFKSLEDKNDNN